MSMMRFSIRSLIFAVFLVAANLTLLAPISGYCPLGYLFGLLGVLPMANILAISCYRTMSRRTVARPFFVGFKVTGLILIVVWFNVCMSADESRLTAFNRWMNRTIFGTPFLHAIADSVDAVVPREFVLLIAYLIFFIFLTTVPQLLLALFVGWVVRRFTAPRNRTLPRVPQVACNIPW